MRKQYHFRSSPDGLLAWDVDRLVALTEPMPVVQVPLAAIRELDEAYWFDHGNAPTCRAVAEHARLIDEADLRYPIILSADGGVMDGMHRVAKALIQKVDRLPAKRFVQDPAPDHFGVSPDDLPYEK